jgi:hypothetical protein
MLVYYPLFGIRRSNMLQAQNNYPDKNHLSG